MTRDFVQFWAVGRIFQNSYVVYIYSSDVRKRTIRHLLRIAEQSSSRRFYRSVKKRIKRFEPAGTPFLYAVFSFFSTGDYDRDYANYRLLSSIWFILGVIILCRLNKLPLLFIPILLYFFSHHFLPFKIEVRDGNLNLIQFGLLSLFLLLKSKENSWTNIAGGLILGFLFFLKPNIILCLVLLGFSWWVHKRRALIIHALCAFLAMSTVAYCSSASFFDSFLIWRDWLAELPQMVNKKIYIKRSFFGQMGYRPDVHIYMMFTLILTGITCFLIFLKKRATPNMRGLVKEPISQRYFFYQDYLCLASGILIYILGANLVHKHYLVLTFPALIYFLRFNFNVDNSILGLFRWQQPVSIWCFTLMRHELSFWSYFGVGILLLMSLWELIYLDRYLMPQPLRFFNLKLHRI